MIDPLIIKAKELLREEMAAQRVTPPELSRRLGVSHPRVHAMMRPYSGTKIDTLQGAFRALGKELDIFVK